MYTKIHHVSLRSHQVQVGLQFDNDFVQSDKILKENTSTPQQVLPSTLTSPEFRPKNKQKYI